MVSSRNEYCGLQYFANNLYTPVPLVSVQVTANVVHCVAEVELAQVYVNRELCPIEVTYFFPIDPLGAVTGFRAEVDGRNLKGIVKPNEDAEKDYNDAVSAGKVALLGSEITGDIFKLKLGNLNPGGVARVLITYLTEVKNDPDSHSIRFVLPTSIAPRYVPGSNDVFGSAHGAPANEISSIVHSQNSVPMSIIVRAKVQGGIAEVKSLSGHQIKVENKTSENAAWSEAVIGLEGQVTEMDRDFVVLITPTESLMKPRVYSEELAGSMCHMLHLIPSFALKEEKVELVVVIDRSGSMGYDGSMQLAGSALDLFFHSLPADCYFNVIGFGSRFAPLFPTSQKYSAMTLAAGSNYAKSINADMGGTEILRPMEYAYGQPRIDEYRRQIFLITDGEVGNTDEVVGLVGRNAGTTRVFGLGVGSRCSRELIEGIAKAGCGTAAFVERDESIQTATLSQLKNALQPTLKNITVEWLGLPEPEPVEVNKEMTLFGYNKPVGPEKDIVSYCVQTPTVIPPIFDGSQLIVFGIIELKGKDVRVSGVRISAGSPDGRLSTVVPIGSPMELANQGILHKLGWVKVVRELELQEKIRFDPRLKGKIVNLAVQNGFASKYTSFVAVDESQPFLVYSTCMRRQVPQFQSQFTSFFGGSSHRSPLRMQQMQCRERSTQVSSSFSSSRQSQYQDRCGPSQHQQPQAACLFGAFVTNTSGSSAHPHQQQQCLPFGGISVFGSSNFGQPKQTVQSFSFGIPGTTFGNSNDPVLTLCTSQNFDGSFSLNTLTAVVELTEVQIQSAAMPGWDITAFATALAIEFLVGWHPQKKNVWELIVAKAEKLLATFKENKMMRDAARNILLSNLE